MLLSDGGLGRRFFVLRYQLYATKQQTVDSEKKPGVDSLDRTSSLMSRLRLGSLQKFPRTNSLNNAESEMNKPEWSF